MIAVYRLPLRDLLYRQLDFIRKIDLSPISDLGLALGVERNSWHHPMLIGTRALHFRELNQVKTQFNSFQLSRVILILRYCLIIKIFIAGDHSARKGKLETRSSFPPPKLKCIAY